MDRRFWLTPPITLQFYTRVENYLPGTSGQNQPPQKLFNDWTTEVRSHIVANACLLRAIALSPIVLKALKYRKMQRHALKRAFLEWIYNKQEQQVCVSGLIICQKGLQIQARANEKLPADQKIETKISEGRLDSFKKR